MKFEYLLNENMKNSNYAETNQSFVTETKELMQDYDTTIN